MTEPETFNDKLMQLLVKASNEMISKAASITIHCEVGKPTQIIVRDGATVQFWMETEGDTLSLESSTRIW